MQWDTNQDYLQTKAGERLAARKSWGPLYLQTSSYSMPWAPQEPGQLDRSKMAPRIKAMRRKSFIIKNILTQANLFSDCYPREDVLFVFTK